MVELIFTVSLSVLFVLVILRASVSCRRLDRTRRIEEALPVSSLSEISVVQPILGGDPTLGAKLMLNTALYPEVEFIWLVDENDELGHSSALRALSSQPSQATIIRVPIAPKDQNPKVFKLAWAYSYYKENVVVLDDDCALAAGSLEKLVKCLSLAGIATGMPFYLEEGTFWSRLLGKFPNGQSVLTYFSVLTRRGASTLNGMFYATTKSRLDQIGGFGAITKFLCDDYELAKLYAKHKLKIFQSTASVNIFTSVPTSSDYAALMHRWAFFSVRQLSELISWRAVILVMLPTSLPLVCLILALTQGTEFVMMTLAVCYLKTETAIRLRKSFFGNLTRNQPYLEILSDFLVPIFFVSGLLTRQIRWRNKIIISNREALLWRD
jgi:ceramide glucosyltransferase